MCSTICLAVSDGRFNFRSFSQSALPRIPFTSSPGRLRQGRARRGRRAVHDDAGKRRRSREGADSDPRGDLLAESVGDTLFQFLRRLVAESQYQQAFRLRAEFFQQVFDASDQRRGLTGPRPGADQRGSAREDRGGDLAVVTLETREPLLSRRGAAAPRSRKELRPVAREPCESRRRNDRR